jgi:hypothetical protein
VDKVDFLKVLVWNFGYFFSGRQMGFRNKNIG